MRVCSPHRAMPLFDDDDDDDVVQEYQDHQSEEEDADLYEKIACTEAAREDKFGSSGDKRRCKSQG